MPKSETLQEKFEAYIRRRFAAGADDADWLLSKDGSRFGDGVYRYEKMEDMLEAFKAGYNQNKRDQRKKEKDEK